MKKIINNLMDINGDFLSGMCFGGFITDILMLCAVIIGLLLR